MLGHEINGGRVDELRRHDQITLVFPIGIVHHDDDLALLQVRDDRFDWVEFAAHSRPKLLGTKSNSTKMREPANQDRSRTVRFRMLNYRSARPARLSQTRVKD